MSVTSLNFSSLNLLKKGQALVYQHFMDLHVATVFLKFVPLKLELIEKSGLGPLGATRSKKYGLPILVTIFHTSSGVHSKCAGRCRFSSSNIFFTIFLFVLSDLFHQHSYIEIVHHTSVCCLSSHSRISLGLYKLFCKVSEVSVNFLTHSKILRF